MKTRIQELFSRRDAEAQRVKMGIQTPCNPTSSPRLCGTARFPSFLRKTTTNQFNPKLSIKIGKHLWIISLFNFIIPTLMAQVEYREYPCSTDPNIKLFAKFNVPQQPRPIRVNMHGWHGQVKQEHSDNVKLTPSKDWLQIDPEMRGRGDATGKPDANGWELQDVVDAVEFAKKTWPDKIANPDRIYLTGGSGGGGNVLALLGKFPDYFCAAICQAGISDYALWYQEDKVGEFRDELKDKGWIGGTPESNPEGYASRGGFTTVENLLTPLLLTHGDLDQRCRVNQARNYVEQAKKSGKEALITYLELKGVGLKSHFSEITPEQSKESSAKIKNHLATNASPIGIPKKGRFVVAGYLKTKSFEVILEHIDRIGEVNYDLDSGKFDIRSKTAKKATLRVLKEGKWSEQTVAIEPPSPPNTPSP